LLAEARAMEGYRPPKGEKSGERNIRTQGVSLFLVQDALKGNECVGETATKFFNEFSTWQQFCGWERYLRMGKGT
jgi:hypothetical protein